MTSTQITPPWNPERQLTAGPPGVAGTMVDALGCGVFQRMLPEFALSGGGTTVPGGSLVAPGGGAPVAALSGSGTTVPGGNFVAPGGGALGVALPGTGDTVPVLGACPGGSFHWMVLL